MAFLNSKDTGKTIPKQFVKGRQLQGDSSALKVSGDGVNVAGPTVMDQPAPMRPELSQLRSFFGDRPASPTALEPGAPSASLIAEYPAGQEPARLEPSADTESDSGAQPLQLAFGLQLTQPVDAGRRKSNVLPQETDEVEFPDNRQTGIKKGVPVADMPEAGSQPAAAPTIAANEGREHAPDHSRNSSDQGGVKPASRETAAHSAFAAQLQSPIAKVDPAEANSLAVNSPADSAPPATNGDSSNPIIHSEPSHSASLFHPPENSMRTRDFSVRLESEEGKKVEIRIFQRGGELRLAVGSGDKDVVQGLRQNLPDLSRQLNQTGVHAEIWKPESTKHSSAVFDSGRGRGDDSPSRDSQPKQQNRDQPEQPKTPRGNWARELASQFAGLFANKGSY
jgi:hypothetical protein